MHNKSTFWRRLGSGVALVALLTAAVPGGAYAATTNITGGTYGPDCGSGGYFTPASVTVDAGDTVTIAVPVNDPYAGGVQVHGFPEGSFTVLPGHSHTTAALTANVSYYGTWPSTGCMKGTGTITVSSPVPPAPQPNPASPGGASSGSLSGGSTGSASPSRTAAPAPTSTSGTATAPPAARQVPAAPDSAAPSADSQTSKIATLTPASSGSQPAGFGPVAVVGGTVVAVLAVAAFVVWRFVLQRHALGRVPAAGMSPGQLPTAGSPPESGTATVQQPPSEPPAR